MITLLASITGFVSSIIPEIIKYLKDINNKKHELQILEKKIQYSTLDTEKRLDEIYTSKDLLEQVLLYSTHKTDIRWIAALNSSVRPILAYSFFIMYIAVKYLQYQTISSQAHIIEYLEVIWNVDDQTIFAGIISFYYGQRTFKKSQNLR